MLVIDVAHPPRKPEEVEDALLEAWSRVRNSDSLRVLKIIHGHGSSGRGGSTRTVVRNWLFRNRARFNDIIEGEEYDVLDGRVMAMRGATGQFPDMDLGAANAGVTVVWMK
ncbi:MAG: hypothetical protein OEM41_09030 [Ignavibacteria bacterium]|nr:hypothetical protein [Ignavibacteria bacterium]